MDNKKIDIVVNFESTDSITSNPIRIFQGDYNSIEFDFTLSKNDYASAVLYMVKPSGAHYVQELDANAHVVFEGSNAFDEAGTYIYRIALYDSDSRLTNTANGKLTVVASDLPSDDEVIAESNYLILDQLINATMEIQETYADMDDKIDEYNANATAKTNAFNTNYQTKIDNVNSSILEYEEETYYSPYADAMRLTRHLSNQFALIYDDRTYGIDIPKFSTSQSSACTKTDDNVSFSCTPGTDTVECIDTYPESWKSVDVNAIVTNSKQRYVTGIKGLENYHDKGKNDCFCAFKTAWYKIWEDNTHIHIRKRYLPTEGYNIFPLAINADGTWNSFFLIPKYTAGDIDGALYNSKDLPPAHYLSMNGEDPSDEEHNDNVCYNGLITLARARGDCYCAGMLPEWMHLLLTFWLKFGTRNTQSIMAGNTSNNYQYQVSQTTVNSNRVIISTANANNIDLLSCVSVGDMGSATDKDRKHAYMHNKAYCARVIGKEAVDSSNTALILDHDVFTTTATCWVSTMHEKSGFSDYVKGRTGSPVSNTNGKHGFVLDGVECAVGGYEVIGNAFMDIINSSGDREIYYTNDATKLTTNVTTAKSTYDKSDIVIRNSALNAWKYITEMGFDAEHGIAVPTNAGQSGSGSNTGYADGLYFDTGTSGQREFLAFGALGNGAIAGLSCLNANGGLSTAAWYILARLSVNGVGGELSE